jgi:thiamine biosynthesis lipoprotein
MSSSFALAALLAVSSLQPYESVEPHMGTLFNIKLYAASEQQAKQAFQAAFSRIAQLDATLSDYRADSELSRATSAVAAPVQISDDLFIVLAKGQWLSEQTGGAFDVTIGALTHLWRQSRRAKALPDPEVLKDALARSGFRKMHLDSVAHTVRFDGPNMQLDVGGIAKGYAADEALVVLSKLGIQSALVAASGDLAFTDAPPGEKGWKISIDALDHPLLLSNAAVSTSGSTEQHFVVNGVLYSHILDPKTGLGLTTNITTTVIAPHGIDADGMATAINVLGPQFGLAFIDKQPSVAAVIATGSNVIESTSFREVSRQPLPRVPSESIPSPSQSSGSHPH